MERAHTGAPGARPPLRVLAGAVGAPGPQPPLQGVLDCLIAHSLDPSRIIPHPVDTPNRGNNLLPVCMSLGINRRFHIGPQQDSTPQLCITRDCEIPTNPPPNENCSRRPKKEKQSQKSLAIEFA